MARLSREEKRELLRKRQAERESKKGDFGSVFDLLDLSQYEDITKFKLKDGLNYLDVLPYEVTTSNHPDGIPVGEDDYKLEVIAHRNVGPSESWVLCLKGTFGLACPICEKQKEFKDKGYENDSKEVKALNASRRCFYNIIDVSSKPETEAVQLFENPGATKPTKWFEALVNSEAKAGGEDIVAFYDLEDGKTIKVRATTETFQKNEFVKPERVDFEDREPYDEDIYDEVFPLDAMIKVPSYADVKALFEGTPQKDSDTDERPSSRKRKTAEPEKKGRSRGAEKEEEKPKRSRRAAKSEPEDDDADGSAGDCPYGHVFGVDHQKTDACADCEDDAFEACGDRFDEIAAAEEKEKPEEKPKSRRRRK